MRQIWRRFAITAAAVASWAGIAAAQGSPQLVNGDFEASAEGRPPPGWTLKSVGGGTFAVDTVRGEHGRGARFGAASATGGQWASLNQGIDAAPWRGKLIRLEARVRVTRAAPTSGLFLRIDRPQPNASGFFDNMQDRPLAEGGWRTVSLSGHVDDDALSIVVGAWMAGAGEVEVDDVSISEATPSASPASAEAAAYLDRAVGLMKSLHMRASELDWAALSARAHREIGGARVPADTYPAIRGLLGTLGDHHSMFFPPTHAAAGASPASAAPAAHEMPTYALLDGRIAVVRLPALTTFGPGGIDAGRRYAETLRSALTAFDAHTLCGWIVDLRADGGGNMWPMLSGLRPLLGAAPWGAFVASDGSAAAWDLGARAKELKLIPAFRVRQARLPLAVLAGPGTASSGEAVTIAFSGRPDSRRFGEDTAGFTTANDARTLSDGAVLAIAASWERDRAGRVFREKIAPDARVPADAAQAAAVAWLESRCPVRNR